MNKQGTTPQHDFAERVPQSTPGEHAADSIDDEPGFTRAVWRALKDFNRPDLLRTNPLTGSRLVATASSNRAPSINLQDLIRAHCERLGQSQKYQRYQQVLERTYLTPLRKQQVVAHELHLSWGTYRRCLSHAGQMLAASLWEAERLLKPEQTVSRVRIWPWLLASSTAVVVIGVVIFGGTLYLHRPRRPEDLHPADSQPMPVASGSPTGNQQNLSETQDLYLTGMEYLHPPTDTNIQHAVDNFHESIQADPANSEAWAALAAAYAIWHNYSSEQRPDSHYQEALGAATRALSLNPSLSLAHAVLGYLRTQHWEWQRARREYQLALQLDPYNAFAHQWYAQYFWLTGDLPRALRELRAADNLDPESGLASVNLGRALTYTGALQAADKLITETIAESPHFGSAYDYLAETHLAMKQYSRVLDDAKAMEAVTRSNPDPILLMESGLAESRLGYKALAARYLASLQQGTRAHYVSGVLTACLYWSLGYKNRSFTELERAAKDHDLNLIMLSGPDCAGIRADPRFTEIRALMQLPPSR